MSSEVDLFGGAKPDFSFRFPGILSSENFTIRFYDMQWLNLFSSRVQNKPLHPPQETISVQLIAQHSEKCAVPLSTVVNVIICDILMLQMIQLHSRNSHGRWRFTRRSLWPCKGVNLSWFISFSAFFLLSHTCEFCLNCSLFFFLNAKFSFVYKQKVCPVSLASFRWNIVFVCVCFSNGKGDINPGDVCSNIPLSSGLQLVQCFRGLFCDLLRKLSKSPAVTLGRQCFSKQSSRACLTLLCSQM